MKQLLFFYVMFLCITPLKVQSGQFLEKHDVKIYAEPLPMPYLLYPFQNKEIAFVRGDLTFMWKIDSIKYPPEKYEFKYDFLIVKIEKGQEPKEAIEKNKPLFVQEDIANYYINYPWDAPELSDGSSYAWRVTSKNKEEFLHSEVSSFIINNKLKEEFYLLYPFQDKEIAFVRNDFTFMWKVDSVKYPPEKYEFKCDFLIVEVEKGQKPQEAIEKNKPLFSQKDITTYYINYPWNAPELSDGVSYAWQVTCKYKEEVFRSKLSTFVINDKLEKRVFLRKYNNYYAELKEKLDASFQVAYDRKLLIKYEELYEVNNQNLRFKIYNDANTIIAQTNETGTVITESVQAVPTFTGLNYLTLNLETAIPVSWGTFYILEIWNAKNERWFLRFTTYYSDPFFILVSHTSDIIRTDY